MSLIMINKSIYNKFLNYGLIEVVSKGANWVTLPLLALVATSTLYGEIAYYYLIIILTSTFFAFGQNRIILSSKKNDINTKKNVSIIISFILFLIIQLFLFLFDCLKFEIFISILCGCLFSINNNLALAIRAHDSLKDFFKIKTYYIIRLFLIFNIIFFFKDLNYYLFFEFFLLLFYFILFSKFNWVRSFETIQLSLKDGFVLMMYSISIYLIMNIDKFIIEHLYSKEILASYYFLYSVSTSFTFILAFFSIKYEREVYSSIDVVSAKNSSNACIRHTILFSFLASPVVFGIYYLYTRLTFLEFKPYWFILLFIAQLIYFLSLKESYILTYLRKNNVIFYSSFFILFVSVTLNYYLIDLFGIIGAIFTLIICYLMFYFIMSCSTYLYIKLEK